MSGQREPLYWEQLGTPPILCKLDILKGFDEVYGEYFYKNQQISLEENLVIYKNKKYTIFYNGKGFFINSEKRPFSSVQSKGIPKKIWEFALLNNKLILTAKDLVGILKENANEQTRNAINKTHRGNFLKRICPSIDADTYSILEKGFLRWELGDLHIFKK